MIAAGALLGWVLAGTALLAAALLRRSLAWRMEAVARASHELRGPLSAVRLGLELGARLGQLSPPRLRAIELELGRTALALDELAGAAESRRCPIALRALERVDVGELLADSVEAWRGAAAARGSALCLRWSGVAGIVVGDHLRLAQATGNLLANAIEHGGGGPIDVHGRVEGERVRIEVVDRGPGLSAPVAELARRGRRHGRGPGAPRGHGLAIASAVAATHGGRLASAPSERGARLVLELPLACGQGIASDLR